MVMIIHGFPNDISALRVGKSLYWVLNWFVSFIFVSLNGHGSIHIYQEDFSMFPRKSLKKKFMTFAFEYYLKCYKLDHGIGCL